MLASFSNVAGSAAVLGNQVYGPYGASRYTKGTMGTSKGFTGQYNDAVTGLDYYNSRYYDPVAGIFLSADTAQGNGVGMNPYAYVGGNPETWSDPTGQMPCGDICGWGGGGGSGSPPASGAGGAAGASSGSNPYTNPYGSSGQANNLPACSVQGVGCKQWAALEVPTVTRVAVTTNSPVGTSFCPMGVGLPCFTSVQEWQSTRYLYFRSSAGAPIELCTAGFDCSSDSTVASEGEGSKPEVLASDESGASEAGSGSAAESAANNSDIVSGGTRPSSPKPFDIIEYGDKAPGFQKHHGVLNVWAQNNIPGYNSSEAPAMVLTETEHNATRSAFAQWRLGRTGSITGYIDWKIVSPREIQELAYNMFDAAGAPEGAVQDYFRAFNQFIYGP